MARNKTTFWRERAEKNCALRKRSFPLKTKNFILLLVGKRWKEITLNCGAMSFNSFK